MTVIDAALKRLANQRRSAKRYRNQTATARPDFSHGQEFDWREGDIAFLRPSTTFSELDYNCLIASNYLPSAATCHPVIILKRRGDDASHVLVTTVSAYGCTSRGPSIAPWKQQCHGGKDVAAFRSFVGSERPNADRPLLRLQENQLMPKPKASWVYLQNIFVVPITVLGKFDKAQRRLRMDKTSLEDLWTQFSGRTQFSKEILADPRLAQSVNGGTVTMKQATAVQQAPPVPRPVVAVVPRPVVASVPGTITTGGVPRRGAQQNNSWASVAAISRPVAVA
ncbi:hypothetical protein CPLU01_11578 [Colletotrichum plurivorum]|uniref:Uncharacterized protein n=1 Tax=Colletotrichum plurivorum TaxID=2175906 RepID=A0A8H6N823_9PEZI|nr:hypothetical protein CPLU01_11578 [Colletotrichum plurivorum]